MYDFSGLLTEIILWIMCTLSTRIIPSSSLGYLHTITDNDSELIPLRHHGCKKCIGSTYRITIIHYSFYILQQVSREMNKPSGKKDKKKGTQSVSRNKSVSGVLLVALLLLSLPLFYITLRIRYTILSMLT